MGGTNVACNIIMRDVEDSIISALDSTQGLFHQYVFCDTGSKDNTKELVESWCKERGVDYKIVDYEGYKYSESDKRSRRSWADIPQYDWDFGDARQIALKETSEDMDWMFWLDTDDIIQGIEELGHVIEDAMTSGVYIVTMPYHYAQDDYGNDLVLHYRERLIRLKDKEGNYTDPKWKDPVHEYLWMPGDVRDKVSIDRRIRHVHKRVAQQVVKTNRRNSRILYRQLEQVKNPDERLLSNLAFDHYEHAEWEEAIKYYQLLFKKLGKKKKVPYIQIYSSYHNYVRCCSAIGELEKAHTIIEKMIELDPTCPDAYLEKAHIYLRSSKFDLCLKYLDLAQEKRKKESVLPTNSMDYTVKPLQMRAEIASATGDLVGAIRYIEQALQYVPGSKSLMDSRRGLLYSLSSKDAFESIFKLREEIYNTGELDKIPHLVGTIPNSILDKKQIQDVIRELTEEYTSYKSRRAIKLKDKKDIGIYVGRAYETWTPETVKKSGIGGSEEMCIHMAKALCDLGNKVTVYNHCGMLEGNYDGVDYVDYRKFDISKEHDVLIVERVPQMFNSRLGAKRQYLWLHDTHYGELPKKLFTLPDRVFVLTEAHKDILQSYYNLPEDVYWVTRNGVRLDHIQAGKSKAGKRNPYGIMYASSYDRGLDSVLRIFPRVREQVPEATLDVFYGWNTYEKRMNMLLEQGNPEGQYMKKLFDQVQTGFEQEGVTHHGRVDQITLTQKHFENSIWLYPTHFEEISCITAMRAQICGTIPVCTDYAALHETVKWGFKLPYPRDEAAFVDVVVDLLKNQKKQEKIRADMMKGAPMAFDINTLAKEWDNFIEQDI